MRGCSRGEGVCVVALGACVVALGGYAWLLLGGGMCGCSRGGMCGCSQGGVCGCSWGGMCGCSRGVCMVARGACMVAPGGHAWLLQGGHAWDMTRYGDTVNERAVRILLECILVKSAFTLTKTETDTKTDQKWPTYDCGGGHIADTRHHYRFR